MGVTNTPINGFTLPDDNELLRNVYLHMRNHAAQLEAALRSHGLTSDDVRGYLDLLGRVNTMDATLTAVAAAVNAATTPGPWIVPNLAPQGWGSYTADGSLPFAYRKEAGGNRVGFRGYLTNTTASLAANAPVFTLDATCRPPSTVAFGAWLATSASAAASWQRFLVAPSGVVTSVYPLSAQNYYLMTSQSFPLN